MNLELWFVRFGLKSLGFHHNALMNFMGTYMLHKLDAHGGYKRAAKAIPQFFSMGNHMKVKTIIAVLLIALLSSSCGAKQATAAPASAGTPEPTITPDPCISQNLPDEVTKVNKLMREFDDYSELASSTPQNQLIQIIPEMQRILRDAEDQQVPPCLTKLKEYQLAHMNVVIKTLIAFMANPNTQLINAGISQAKQLHDQYSLEMARLLGITLAVPATFTPLPGTPASGVPAAFSFVTNTGTDPVVLRSSPDPNAGGVAMLEAGLTTGALGKTSDGKWIQVEVPGQPGQKAWVDASLVSISGDVPVVTP